MIKMFEKFTTNVVGQKGKSINEVIEEIHETFYTEVDRLLASAKIANSLDTDKQGLIDKSTRLKSLGFTNTKEVKEAEEEIVRLNKLRRDNEVKETLVEAINYFSFKYPNYRFITEESVRRICEKYNLVYGPIDRYTGTVPDKNLKHIEDFKVLEDDECFIHETFWGSPIAGIRNIMKEYITIDGHKEKQKRRSDYDRAMLRMDYMFREINMKCPLEIAAPSRDFNMQGMEVKEHKISKIEIPDPVVLKPVIFNNQKYYLIVTAWGMEAGDELVVNAKHN